MRPCFFARVIALTTIVAGSLAGQGAEDGAVPPVPGRWAETEVLFSNDEKAVIEYLKTHDLPMRIENPAHGFHGDGPFDSDIIGQLFRAADLFHNGSSELRLAIARKLSSDRIVFLVKDGTNLFFRMWKECALDDEEAKHWLAGYALHGATAEERDEVLQWFRTRAHPSYASALLRGLNSPRWLDEPNDCWVGWDLKEQRPGAHVPRPMTDAEKDDFIPFLKDLYRQVGTVRVYTEYAAYLEGNLRKVTKTVPAAAVLILPGTRAGANTLLAWMESDSKKLGEDDLRFMWGRWNNMVVTLNEPAGRDKQILDQTVGSLAMTESYVLHYGDRTASEFICTGWESWKPFAQAFRQRLWEQVYNPDQRVQRAALRYALATHKESASFIKGLAAPASLRASAKSLLEHEFSPEQEQENKMWAEHARKHKDGLAPLLAALEGR